MRFKKGDIPPLWLRPGHRAEGDGTATPAGPEVREALREVRRGASLRVPETDDEIAEALDAYRIHPLFFEGTAAELAAEYLQAVHGIDAAGAVPLWLRLAHVARERLDLSGPLPVPVLDGAGQA